MRSVHDPFELKGWIEQKLRQIWKLDSALNEAEIAGEIDLGGGSRADFEALSPLR